MKQYAAVTNDRYELISYMADSMYKLADMLGTTKDAVFKALKRGTVICKQYKIIKIEWEDDNGTSEDS